MEELYMEDQYFEFFVKSRELPVCARLTQDDKVTEIWTPDFQTINFVMDIRFDGKKALVTGAGKGIGRDVAKALAAGGAETYALSRTQADLDSLKAEVPGIHCVNCDISDWSTARKTIESLGVFDLLVNNAGVARNHPVLEVTEDDIDKSFSTNVKALINVSQVIAKGMVERGNGGAIINVSSQASQVALQDHLVYCSSKGAVDQATRCMALELGKHQIRVNAVNPTVVLTEMGKRHWSDPAKGGPMLSKIPMGRFAEVKDVVHPILYLLSDKADMINGVTLPIDGGFLAT